MESWEYHIFPLTLISSHKSNVNQPCIIGPSRPASWMEIRFVKSIYGKRWALRRVVSPKTRLLKVLLKIARVSIGPAPVINLSEATAVAWVQTVRNPAGERALSNEEGEPFSATASKQLR